MRGSLYATRKIRAASVEMTKSKSLLRGGAPAWCGQSLPNRLCAASGCVLNLKNGRVAERLMAPVLKTGVPERVSGVRIPPLPPPMDSTASRDVLRISKSPANDGAFVAFVVRCGTMEASRRRGYICRHPASPLWVHSDSRVFRWRSQTPKSGKPNRNTSPSS